MRARINTYQARNWQNMAGNEQNCVLRDVIRFPMLSYSPGREVRREGILSALNNHVISLDLARFLSDISSTSNNHSNTYPLYHDSSISAYAIIPICNYINIMIYDYSNIDIYEHDSIYISTYMNNPTYEYMNIQVYEYMNIDIYGHMNMRICRYTDNQLSRYTNLTICRGIHSPVGQPIDFCRGIHRFLSGDL